MNLQYRYTLPDYRALTHMMIDQRWVGRWWRRWAIYLGIVLMIAGTVLVAFSSVREWRIEFFATVLGGLGGAIIALQCVVVPWQIRRYYRKQALDGALIGIDANETEVRTNDRGIESRIEWSAFVRASDSPGYHFLWLNQIQGIIVPDRVFASEAQRQEFRKLVERRMPDRVKWPRQPASPDVAASTPE